MTGFRHDTSGTPAELWAQDERWTDVPAVTPDQLRAAYDTVVVVAAHPDDETLGAGVLTASAHDLGIRVELVLLTAGEHSHPQSPTHSSAALREQRLREADAAVEALAPGATTTFLGLGDGAVAAHEADVVARLVDLVGDGRRTLLVAPWHGDGHPDHEAAGRAAGTAAHRTGAEVWHYPVWFWHWGLPDAAPWDALVRLAVTPELLARKRAALRAHRSQVEALSGRAGDEVLLTPEVLAHFLGAREAFLTSRATGQAGSDGNDRALDDLHRAGAEPWGADRRWYEERKRAVLLACLPRRRSTRALELGCSTGVLTASLAERCGQLVAVDSSAHALETARRRLQSQPHVSLEHHRIPETWPEGSFDLVVLSEVGYFLSPAALEQTLDRVRECLAESGVVALCHWRHPVDGWPLDGPRVHRAFREAGLPPELCSHHERDFEVVVLADPAQLPDPQR